MRRKQQRADKHKNKIISSRKGAHRIGTINKKLPRKKSATVVSENPKETVAKQLLRRIIGKPKDREDAVSILSSLSGKQHQVITGVVILNGENEIAFAEITEVHFHELSLAQIEFYVDNYKPYDKAGAYAIQEWIGVVGIKSVKGDFYNVMGLPVSRVVQALQSL